MENDSIRSSGTDTLVDIWVNGKLRAICVSSQAIDASLGSDRRSELTDEDRCEFVRTHLPLLVTAVKARLRDTNPDANVVTIEIGHLGGTADRRKGDRRNGDRRKKTLPKESLPHGERRRGDRRKTERRAPKS